MNCPRENNPHSSIRILHESWLAPVYSASKTNWSQKRRVKELRSLESTVGKPFPFRLLTSVSVEKISFFLSFLFLHFWTSQTIYEQLPGREREREHRLQSKLYLKNFYHSYRVLELDLSSLQKGEQRKRELDLCSSLQKRGLRKS